MPRKSTKIRMIFCENKKISHSPQGPGTPGPSPYGKTRYFGKAVGGTSPTPTVRQDLPSPAAYQHRLCPARCVPGKGHRAAVGADDLLDDVQTQNVGRILPRFTGLQGVQHRRRVARAVVGYRDPQCFSAQDRRQRNMHAGALWRAALCSTFSTARVSRAASACRMAVSARG